SSFCLTVPYRGLYTPFRGEDRDGDAAADRRTAASGYNNLDERHATQGAMTALIGIKLATL
ncbi:hypothetical protein N9O45_03435, partial [Planktomarina temperata]|nr:hypothetical protein [Planktomarina temperata]